MRRKEDFCLLSGRGSFVDDIRLPKLAHAAVMRSPHAQARILSIDTAAALSSPGMARRLLGRRGGTTPAPAAVIAAIVDALAELGVSHIKQTV